MYQTWTNLVNMIRERKFFPYNIIKEVWENSEGQQYTQFTELTPTKRKLIIDQNIDTLISSFEDTAANFIRGEGWGGGEEKVQPSEGGVLM
jgi:hypothetical protein